MTVECSRFTYSLESKGSLLRHTRALESIGSLSLWRLAGLALVFSIVRQLSEQTEPKLTLMVKTNGIEERLFMMVSVCWH